MFAQRNRQGKKLNFEQVQEMRRLYGEGETQGVLGKRFGVSVVQVGRIVRGESWTEGAGLREPTQAEMDETARRVLALQAEINKAPQVATMAEEFEAVLKGQRRPPPSLLDGGELVNEQPPTGLTELERQAALAGVDIDRLRKVRL